MDTMLNSGANMPKAIRTKRADTKVARAARIFSQMANYSRSMVIQRFQKELDLTEKGASTYYQNCRKTAGLVGGRDTAASK